MPNFLHRTSKQSLRSVSYPDLPEPIANYIEEPDLSAVEGQPVKYWIIIGDVISLVDLATRDSIDAAAETTRLDNIADELDHTQTIMRAFAETVLDEFNSVANKVNQILDAIDSANNLTQLKSNVAAITDRPQRTLAQLKSAVRSKL